MTQARLVIPSRADQLPSVRELVEIAARQAGFGPQEVQRIVTAVFEAVVNAITHGSPLGPANSVGIEIRVYADRLVVAVADQGPGFIQAGFPEMPGAGAPRGRGIPLMLALVDKVEFSSTDGAKVTLTKYFPS